MLSVEPPKLDFTASGSLLGSDLRLLDRIAAEKVQEFNSLLASVAKGRERNIDWWVSRPAGRNTHTSDLFAYCIQLALVRHYLDQGIVPRVQTDSAAMARILCSEIGEKNVTSVRRSRHWGRIAHDVGSTLYHASMAKAAAWVTRKERRATPDKTLHLVEVYVLRDSFSGTVYNDRYFPGLYESLNSAQCSTFYYFPIFHRLRDYKGTFQAMRRSARNFLLREDYLRLSDYLFALGHWWRVRRLVGRKANFAGFDVGPLVDNEIRIGCFANSAFQALLTYRFWSKRAWNILRVARFLDWYEGHDFDHAAAAALSWSGSPIEHVAVRPIASPAYLSLTPTHLEVMSGVTARRWGIVGTLACEEMRHALPELSVQPAPGLRHRWASKFKRKVTEGPVNILILLSIEAAHVRLVHRFISPVMGREEMKSFRWLLKPHPAMPRDEVKRIFLQEAGAISLLEGSFSDALGQADIVVGLGTNTLIEAIAVGVPVICVSCGNKPTEIPLSSSTEAGWWRMAYDPEDFSRLLPEALAASKRQQGRSSLVSELLGPFDPDILRAILFATE